LLISRDLSEEKKQVILHRNQNLSGNGEVSEWLKEPVSKTGVGLRRPRVRIPASPPFISFLQVSNRNPLCPKLRAQFMG
jgi:hypothetical protein